MDLVHNFKEGRIVKFVGNIVDLGFTIGKPYVVRSLHSHDLLRVTNDAGADRIVSHKRFVAISEIELMMLELQEQE